MKRSVLFFSIGVLIMCGCGKKDSCIPKTVASEDGAMQNFILANSINATQHSTGMYYEIVNSGNGQVPTYSNTLSVTFTGKLLDGTIFSSTSTPVSFQLANVIAGWQIGLSLLQEGGVIKMIIPSSLAYGCRQQGAIPPNSILYFEVNLVDVF